MADALPLKAHRRVTKADKVEILGEASLLPMEVPLDDDAPVILFHWEKDERVWREIFHHYGLTSITTASCGRGNMLIAALKSGVKVLALARNERHAKVLREMVIDFMIEESANNEACPYFISMAKMTEQLGLEHINPPGPASDDDEDTLSWGPVEVEAEADGPCPAESENADEGNAEGNEGQADEVTSPNKLFETPCKGHKAAVVRGPTGGGRLQKAFDSAAAPNPEAKAKAKKAAAVHGAKRAAPKSMLARAAKARRAKGPCPKGPAAPAGGQGAGKAPTVAAEAPSIGAPGPAPPTEGLPNPAGGHERPCPRPQPQRCSAWRGGGGSLQRPAAPIPTPPPWPQP